MTGCEACDGPDETLQRHETDARGVTTVSTLIGPGAEVLGGQTIGQIDAVPDGSVLAVATCADAYCGGLGNRPNAITWRFLISEDGGAAWKVLHETSANYAYIEDVTTEGLIIGEVLPDGSVPSPQRHTVVGLSGKKRVIPPPPGSSPFARAILLWAGQVAWMERSDNGSAGRLLREDGTVMALPSGLAFDDAQVLNHGGLAFLSRVESRLSVYSIGPNRVDVVNLRGHVPWGITGGGRTVVANNFVSGAGPNAKGPVLIDLVAMTATPLTTEFLKAQPGRNRFVAFAID